MTKSDLDMIRNMLLMEVKLNKSDDYRSGYVDGVLDVYNEVVRKCEELAHVGG